MGVHGAEERGERVEQRNSGAGRKEELTRWGRLVSDVASGAVRAERGVAARWADWVAGPVSARCGSGGRASER